MDTKVLRANAGGKRVTYGPATTQPDGATTYDAVIDGTPLCNIVVRETASPPTVRYEYYATGNLVEAVVIHVDVRGEGRCPSCSQRVQHDSPEGTRVHGGQVGCAYDDVYIRKRDATGPYRPVGL